MQVATFSSIVNYYIVGQIEFRRYKSAGANVPLPKYAHFQSDPEFTVGSTSPIVPTLQLVPLYKWFYFPSGPTSNFRLGIGRV